MSKVDETIEQALDRAWEHGVNLDTRQLRRFNGRSRPVRPGFNPWGRRPSLSSPGDFNEAEFAQIEVARKLRALRDRVKAGDKTKTVEATYLAIEHGIIPPAWLAEAFSQIMRRFYLHEVKSLDEAFGHEPLSERTRRMLHERKVLAPAVYRLAVGVLRRRLDDPVDAIIDEVAELLEIGTTKCRELYDFVLTHPEYVPLPRVREIYKRHGSGET
jgi:hypothetical protein